MKPPVTLPACCPPIQRRSLLENWPTALLPELAHPDHDTIISMNWQLRIVVLLIITVVKEDHDEQMEKSWAQCKWKTFHFLLNYYTYAQNTPCTSNTWRVAFPHIKQFCDTSGVSSIQPLLMLSTGDNCHIPQIKNSVQDFLPPPKLDANLHTPAGCYLCFWLWIGVPHNALLGFDNFLELLPELRQSLLTGPLAHDTGCWRTLMNS